MLSIHAPEFPQNYSWLNTDQPLSIAKLKGRIILLDFWTYCCINCLHILHDLKYLENKYKHYLTVIGVHSAKFDHEQEIENIRQAILRYDIEHPVLIDQNYHVWQQYTVRGWPTLVIIDPKGYYVSSIAGEGNLARVDEMISDLIQQHQNSNIIQSKLLNFTLEKQNQLTKKYLSFPGKVLADRQSDRLFIADSRHHRIVITNSKGKILQTIGIGDPGLKDGQFNQAQFSTPQGMTLDEKQQILYVADTDNHAIRAIDFNKEIVTTIAGNGSQSNPLLFKPKIGIETALNSPWDIEKVGDQLFIVLAGSHQIGILDLETNLFRIYAGRGAESCVDGDAIEAAFAQPSGITTNGIELFIADSETSCIRGVSLGENPQVRTICGSGELFKFGDRDGQGFEVRLQHCLGVEYANHYLWVADTYNHKIKQIDINTGICKTITGNYNIFSEPSGLSIKESTLYIADTNHHQIKQLDLDDITLKTLPLNDTDIR
ncbi:MAG: thioredoxin-like domain-containing protein [Microcoleaceae cyanobacterium]